MPLQDSDALIEGAPAAGKPYLGAPSVVDMILRHALYELTEARGRGDDVAEFVRGKAGELSEIFLGRNDSYQPSFWNREQGLAVALVERADVGGDPSDAVLRLFVRFFRLFAEALGSTEDGRMTQEQLQASVDELLAKYTQILVGSGDA